MQFFCVAAALHFTSQRYKVFDLRALLAMDGPMKI